MPIVLFFSSSWRSTHRSIDWLVDLFPHIWSGYIFNSEEALLNAQSIFMLIDEFCKGCVWLLFNKIPDGFTRPSANASFSVVSSFCLTHVLFWVESTNQSVRFVASPGSASDASAGIALTFHHSGVKKKERNTRKQHNNMPGADKETDLSERIEAFLADLKRGGTGSGPLRGSAETARKTTALLRRITAQARWGSAGGLLPHNNKQQQTNTMDEH